MDGCWYVYLAECGDGSLYCGITTDPARRLAQHNGERPGGARYTRARRPVRLAAMTPCPDRSAAARLERSIQKARRADKRRLLEEASIRFAAARADAPPAEEIGGRGAEGPEASASDARQSLTPLPSPS